MNMPNKLLIHYESTKYIYRQKNDVFRYEKSKCLFQDVAPQCISSILSIKLQQFTFSLAEETWNPKIYRLCMLFELNEQQANHYYLDLRE